MHASLNPRVGPADDSVLIPISVALVGQNRETGSTFPPLAATTQKSTEYRGFLRITLLLSQPDRIDSRNDMKYLHNDAQLVRWRTGPVIEGPSEVRLPYFFLMNAEILNGPTVEDRRS